MTKRITISDKDYYLILGLKAKHLTDSIEEIIRLEGSKPYNLTDTCKAVNPITTKADNHTTITAVCQCGHVIDAHDDTGCMGNGGLCECKKYVSG